MAYAKSQRPSWTEVTRQGTPRLRIQVLLAGGEGTPKPQWCPEWSLSSPAVTMTAGPLPLPSPHPGAAAGVDCQNSVDPTRKQVQGRGRDHPPQGAGSVPAQRAPESLSPALPRPGGTCRQEFWVRCPSPKPWGLHTHTHTRAHACTRTHTHIHTRAHAHAHAHVCTRTHMPTRLHTRAHAHTHAGTHACTRTRTHAVPVSRDQGGRRQYQAAGF